MKLSIVIVNTSEWKVLQPCLASVFRETEGFPFEVIVVDNASTDGSRDHIAREFPRVRIVCNERNLGFGASNNRGFRVVTGEYVLMLNPDTVVLDGAIQKTLRFMEERPRAGIAACRLRFLDRSLQHSIFTFPSVWNIFCETFFLGKLLPGTRLFGNFNLRHFAYDRERQVDSVSGAFLMMRRAVLDLIGLLDEQFYMYTEEVDFCYRAKQVGYEVWFTPAGEVLHFWGGESAVNRRILLWTVGSQMLFYQKHFRGISRVAVIALKYTGLLLRCVLWGAGGTLLLRRSFLEKSSSYFHTLTRVLGAPWRYRHGYSGSVEPWPRN